jgi:hypothetical protein
MLALFSPYQNACGRGSDQKSHIRVSVHAHFNDMLTYSICLFKAIAQAGSSYLLFEN